MSKYDRSIKQMLFLIIILSQAVFLSCINNTDTEINLNAYSNSICIPRRNPS